MKTLIKAYIYAMFLLTTSCTSPNLLWKTKIAYTTNFSPVIDDYLFYKTVHERIAFINTTTQAVGQDTIVEVARFHDLATYQERTLVGVEIHIGRNRIVRRIFTHLGYDVVKLDRTMYAGLNKKEIDRGDWRYLSEKEVIRLKYFA